MVAVFLGGEIMSPRWGKKIEEILVKYKIDRNILDIPDINSKDENTKRAMILGEFRGYGKKDGLFDDLSEITSWKLVTLGKSDIKKIKYIDYDYWNELWGGSRLVIDGVENIKKGMEVFGESNDQFWELAKKIQEGYRFPPLILTMSKEFGLKILEGHVRLTAYLLASESLRPIDVIVGFKNG